MSQVFTRKGYQEALGEMRAYDLWVNTRMRQYAHALMDKEEYDQVGDVSFCWDRFHGYMQCFNGECYWNYESFDVPVDQIFLSHDAWEQLLQSVYDARIAREKAEDQSDADQQRAEELETLRKLQSKYKDVL